MSNNDTMRKDGRLNKTRKGAFGALVCLGTKFVQVAKISKREESITAKNLMRFMEEISKQVKRPRNTNSRE